MHFESSHERLSAMMRREQKLREAKEGNVEVLFHVKSCSNDVF